MGTRRNWFAREQGHCPSQRKHPSETPLGELRVVVQSQGRGKEFDIRVRGHLWSRRKLRLHHGFLYVKCQTRHGRRRALEVVLSTRWSPRRPNGRRLTRQERVADSVSFRASHVVRKFSPNSDAEGPSGASCSGKRSPSRDQRPKKATHLRLTQKKQLRTPSCSRSRSCNRRQCSEGKQVKQVWYDDRDSVASRDTIRRAASRALHALARVEGIQLDWGWANLSEVLEVAGVHASLLDVVAEFERYKRQPRARIYWSNLAGSGSSWQSNASGSLRWEGCRRVSLIRISPSASVRGLGPDLKEERDAGGPPARLASPGRGIRGHICQGHRGAERARSPPPCRTVRCTARARGSRALRFSHCPIHRVYRGRRCWCTSSGPWVVSLCWR